MARFESVSATPRGRLAGAFLVAAVALLAHGNALFNGFLADDRLRIVENRRLTAPGAVFRALGAVPGDPAGSTAATGVYRPLVDLSYIGDLSLFGNDPVGFHLRNVLLHALAAALCLLVVADAGTRRPAALAGAALFAVHPALGESVARIAGRPDLLATVLILGCLLADGRRHRRFGRAVAIGTLALALLAMEIAVVAPVLGVLAALRRGEAPRRAVMARLDLVAVVVAWMALRGVLLGSSLAAGLVAGGFPSSARGLAIPHLVGLLVLPWRGRVEYPVGLLPGLLLPAAAAGVLLVVLLTLSSSKPDAGGQSLAQRFLLLAGVVAFVPAAVTVLVGGTVRDGLVYLPSAFLLPALALMVARSLERRTAAAVLLAAVVAGGSWTAVRTGIWRSDRTVREAARAESHAAPGAVPVPAPADPVNEKPE